MPKSMQIREACALPNGAKETVVHPAKDAKAEEEEGPNSEANGPRIATPFVNH